MCGRTCLTLQPNEIQCACSYNRKVNIEQNSDEAEKKQIPEWRSEFNCGKKYQPLPNISPSNITPVIVSAKHFNSDSFQDRVIVPMMWGMIPFWHKGDYRKHGLTTNNCRLEHMLESKLYKRPFFKGQRCVAVYEGFYEWQTTKVARPSERSVYFIHMPQENGVKIYDRKTWNNIENLNLLKIAGLFDIWEDEIGDKLYSYSVITYESDKKLSWLHHRTPAILETEEQVTDWLDFGTIKNEAALNVIKRPINKVSWYEVSNIVNNSRNQSDQCNKPKEEVQKSIIPKSKIMQSWLTVCKRKTDNDGEASGSSGTFKHQKMLTNENNTQSMTIKTEDVSFSTTEIKKEDNTNNSNT